MALLSVDKRKEFFKGLGLGEYNKANIKALQKKYMARKSDTDGIYGKNTDNLLRHLWNCKLYLKPENFKPQEFKCECNGRYCCGYPTYMKPTQLKNLQAIRSHYNRPMAITSGMRCIGYNRSIGGSISNSKHLLGQATDFYMAGVTDTLANRKKFIKYAKTLKNTTYIYGNGINIYGNRVYAPYMGNAIHYDTKNEPKATTSLPASAVGINGSTSAAKKVTPKPEPKPEPKSSVKSILVEKAKELAWAKGTPLNKYKWRGGRATKAFTEALNKVYPKHNQWGQKAPRVGCSCDVFAGTVLRASKLEPSVPRGLREQYAYKPKNFARKVYKNVAPIDVSKDGDVVLYKKTNGGGHILIRGDKGIYEAGFENTYGHFDSSLSKIKIKRPYVIVWSAR